MSELWSPLFTRLALARALSLVGSSLTLVAAPVLVYQLTKDLYWVAITGVTESLPYFLFGYFGGIIADRVRPRVLMVLCDLTAACALASVTWASIDGSVTAIHVIVAAFLSRVAGAFFDAATFPFVIKIVRDDELGRANSVLYGWMSSLEVIGPLIAALLLLSVTPGFLIGIDALTFFLSASILVGRSTPVEQPEIRVETFMQSAATGIRFAISHRAIVVLTALSLTMCLGVGGLVSQMVVWADLRLNVHSGDARLGALFAALALGMIFGGVAVERRYERTAGSPKWSPPALIMSIGGMLAVLATDWAVAALAVMMAGMGWSMCMIVFITMRQRETPAGLQGRVNALSRSIAFGLGWTVGALAVPLLTRGVDLHLALGLLFFPGLIVAGFSFIRTTSERSRVPA